jgi:hypothetical protein
LYKIKLKVDQQMRINSDAQKREAANSTKPTDGPLSKANFDRFYQAMKATHGAMGMRKASKLDGQKVINDIIVEDPKREEENDDGEESDYSVADVDNPLISAEQVKIIEAAIPKYTMQQLLGLSDHMYLTLKNTEFWLKKHGHGHRSKEKHFEFAKDLFKIWDADGGGFLDVDEISLPLIALGLSTDTGFVEKLIKALKKKK